MAPAFLVPPGLGAILNLGALRDDTDTGLLSELGSNSCGPVTTAPLGGGDRPVPKEIAPTEDPSDLLDFEVDPFGASIALMFSTAGRCTVCASILCTYSKYRSDLI